MRITAPRAAIRTAAVALAPLALVASLATPVAAAPMSAGDESGRAAFDAFPYPDAELTLINHRGLSPEFPENTLAAFRNSIALGVDVIEIDLRATKDGHVVILHDDTVDRTTDGTGPLSALTLEEVKSLDAGSYVSPEFAGEEVPTYAETLDTFKDTGVKLLLDIKITSQVEQIVRLAEDRDMVEQIIVGPRSVANLNDYLAINPDLSTLGFIPTPESADDFIDAGVDYIRLWPHWITASRDDAACQADYADRVAAYEAGERVHPGSASCAVERVASRGTPVWSTTNDLGYAGMDELLQLGATGLLSDLPGELARLLDDVEAQRVSTAAGQLATLQGWVDEDFTARNTTWRSQVDVPTFGPLLREVSQVRRDLDRSTRAVSRDDVVTSCTSLQQLVDRAAGTTAPEITGTYTLAAQRIAATLACSRF